MFKLKKYKRAWKLNIFKKELIFYKNWHQMNKQTLGYSLWIFLIFKYNYRINFSRYYLFNLLANSINNYYINSGTKNLNLDGDLRGYLHK